MDERMNGPMDEVTNGRTDDGWRMDDQSNERMGEMTNGILKPQSIFQNLRILRILQAGALPTELRFLGFLRNLNS